MRADRAAGLLLGFAADRLLGDPQRYHPVAGFGMLAGRLERRLHADSRLNGAVFAITLVGGAVVVGAAAERLPKNHAESALMQTFSTALATWMVLGGRSLEREADAVHALLVAEDLPAARRQVSRLVGRDTARLSASEVARAVVESVAENTSDAVVAPLFWGAIAGVPGLLAYRAANTLDAMVGHHNERYEHFGWASARLDDLLNLPASRLAALLVVAGPGGGAAARAWRADAAKHPSPNAGVVEAAFAGALGIRLGGTNTYYGDRVEHRAVLGGGRPAAPADVARATRLARRVDLGAAVVAAVIAVAVAAGRVGARRARASADQV